MALPNVKANSIGGAEGTQPGYIYWDAFNIQYLGTSYGIPAGNTDQRWVWWRYNTGGATTLLEAGPDVPLDLKDDDIVLLGNKNGIPVRVQSTSVVDGELIVDGTILAKALSVGAVTADNADIQSLWSAMLEADYVQAGFVLTGAIQIGDVNTPNPITISGADGIVLPQPDGGEIRLPTDGSAAKVTADLIATSLSVKDDLTINGLGQVNGQIDLANGVGTPKVAPTISQEWPSFPLSGLTSTGEADNGSVYNGLDTYHADAGFMVTAVNYFGSGIRVVSRTGGGIKFYPDPTNDSGPQMLPNGSFDVDASGWVGMTRVTTPVRSGSGAGAITATFAMDAFAQTVRIPVAAGQSYDLSAYVRAAQATSRSAAVDAIWYNAASGGSALSSTSGAAVAINSTGYTYVSSQGVKAPTGATHVVLSVRVTGGVAANETFYIDDAKLGTAKPTWIKDFYSWGGIARVGSDYYVMGSDNARSKLYIYRISGTTWDKTAELLWNSDLFYHDGYLPRLVSDGTEVGVVWTVPSTGNLTLRWYKGDLSGRSATAGRTADINLYTNLGQKNIGDVVWGDTGNGAVRLWVAIRNQLQVMSFNPAASYARVTGEDFDRAGGSMVMGMMYDGNQGRMIHFDNYGKLWTYSKVAVTGSQTVSAAYTYYDGDSAVYPAGTIINGVDVSGQVSGAHETLPSPTSTFTLKRRAWPVFETQPPPDEKVQDATRVDKANRIGLYISAAGGTLYRQGYLTNTAGVAQRVVRGIDAFPASGTVPTTNGFASAAAAPGLLTSAAVDVSGQKMIRLSGDGSGRVGPLKWGADGQFPHGEFTTASAQSIPNATWTNRTGYARVDTVSGVNGYTYTASGVFTFAEKGLYFISALITYDNNSTGRRLMRVQRGTVTEAQVETDPTLSGSAVNPSLSWSGTIWINAGDTIEIQCYQNSGAALTTVAGAASNRFSFLKVMNF